MKSVPVGVWSKKTEWRWGDRTNDGVENKVGCKRRAVSACEQDPGRPGSNQLMPS